MFEIVVDDEDSINQSKTKFRGQLNTLFAQPQAREVKADVEFS